MENKQPEGPLLKPEFTYKVLTVPYIKNIRNARFLKCWEIARLGDVPKETERNKTK